MKLSSEEAVRQASRLIQEARIDDAVELLFPVNTPEALTLLASCYSVTGQYDKSISTIDHVIDNAVGYANIARGRNNKALLLIDNDRLDEARQFFVEALEAVNKVKNKRKRIKERDLILINAEFCLQNLVAEELSYITHPLSYQCLHELLMLADPLLDDANDWKLVKSKRRVDIFRRKQQKDATGRTINAFKGVGLVRAKPREMASLVTDVGDYRRQLDPFFKTGTVVSREGEIAIVHLVYQTSKCVIEIHRDFLICQHMYELPNGTVVVASKSHTDQTMVLPEQNCVRADLLMAGWVFQPAAGGLCDVTYVTRADLKDIPTTILNTAAESQPLIIDRLRRLIVSIDEEKQQQQEAKYEFEVKEVDLHAGKNAFSKLTRELAKRPRGNTAENMMLPSPSASPSSSPAGSPRASTSNSVGRAQGRKLRSASIGRSQGKRMSIIRPRKSQSVNASPDSSPRRHVPGPQTPPSASPRGSSRRGTRSKPHRSRSAPNSPRHSVGQISQSVTKSALPALPPRKRSPRGSSPRGSPNRSPRGISPKPSPRRSSPKPSPRGPSPKPSPSPRRALPTPPTGEVPSKPLPQEPFFSFPLDLSVSMEAIPVLEDGADASGEPEGARGRAPPTLYHQESEMIDLDEIAALNEDLLAM